MTQRVNVLFVCMGNICRSPMAEGVFLRDINNAGLASDIGVDSAGTHAYHIGKPPDERGCLAATKRQVEIGSLQARRIEMADFSHFDYILAMDRQNLDMLRYLCPPRHRDSLHLFSEFSPQLKNREIPDPYLGKQKNFEEVLDLIEIASHGLVDTIEPQLR